MKSQKVDLVEKNETKEKTNQATKADPEPKKSAPEIIEKEPTDLGDEGWDIENDDLGTASKAELRNHEPVPQEIENK